MTGSTTTTTTEDALRDEATAAELRIEQRRLELLEAARDEDSVSKAAGYREKLRAAHEKEKERRKKWDEKHKEDRKKLAKLDAAALRAKQALSALRLPPYVDRALLISRDRTESAENRARREHREAKRRRLASEAHLVRLRRAGAEREKLEEKLAAHHLLEQAEGEARGRLGFAERARLDAAEAYAAACAAVLEDDEDDEDETCASE